MTFKRLQKIIKDNGISENVRLLSDSGWECSATDMDGVFYSAKENTIVFTQIGEEILNGKIMKETTHVKRDFPDAKMIYSYAMLQKEGET